ncbi:MAG: cytochrome b/b6 domain-containing protein [Terricaulis sp.]
MSAAPSRYSAVAIVLHWAIAAAIVFMVPLGWWMHQQAEHGGAGEGLYRAFQLHKSVGLTVLALSVARLGWRLANPAPPLPAHMPAWEKLAASATHWAFYFLIVALPLSGWLYVSAQWSHEDNQPLAVSTHWFGLFRVPALFGLPEAGNQVRAAVAEGAFTAHYLLAYASVALLALHVGAALKHQFVDRDDVLSRMVPGLRAPGGAPQSPSNPARLAILGVGLGLTAFGLAAALYAASTFGAHAPLPQANSSIELPALPGAASSTPATETPAPSIAVGEPNPSAPLAAWRVDASASSVGFSFVYSDDENAPQTFSGRFSRWRADIRFDPNELKHSFANVTIETGSASDGNAWHDRSLPTPAWFDSASHPEATFRTASIRHRQGNRYEARGALTIKGNTRAVNLPFTLEIVGDRAIMDGALTINRRDFGVGNGSSDGDEKVSRDIAIAIHVVATRKS